MDMNTCTVCYLTARESTLSITSVSFENQLYADGSIKNGTKQIWMLRPRWPAPGFPPTDQAKLCHLSHRKASHLDPLVQHLRKWALLWFLPWQSSPFRITHLETLPSADIDTKISLLSSPVVPLSCSIHCSCQTGPRCFWGDSLKQAKMPNTNHLNQLEDLGV